MKEEEWQQFSNLLFFENHLEDEKANYLAVERGYLFRRDNARLVAFKMSELVEGAKHFPMQTVEKGVWDKVQLVQEQLLFTNEKEEEHSLLPVAVPYETHSLQTLFWEEFDSVIRIQSKSVAKVLLGVQRKLLNLRIPLHQVDVALNGQEKTLTLVLPTETISYPITMEVAKEGTETVQVYSYLVFRDLLMHANSFNKEITLSSYQSYFTKIDYDEKTKAVLNHKRKRVQEN